MLVRLAGAELTIHSVQVFRSQRPPSDNPEPTFKYLKDGHKVLALPLLSPWVFGAVTLALFSAGGNIAHDHHRQGSVPAMLPLPFATKAISDLAAGNIAIISTPAGNMVALAMSQSPQMKIRKRVLMIGHMVSWLDTPRTIDIPSQQIAIDLGERFSVEFDFASIGVAVREQEIKRSFGSILVLGNSLIMVAAGGENASEFDPAYIDLRAGDFVSCPSRTESVEMSSWRLRLHSDRSDTTPVTLCEWPRQAKA